jgi:steroid 5-alpha reductase family enzyme
MDAVLALVIFAMVWALCLRVKNYGFLDVTWTLSIGLMAVLDATYGSGGIARRLLFSGLGLIWSLRLGTFVLVRVLRHHPSEDKRYRSLRERWTTPLQFLVFFELQAIIAVVFSLPFLIAAFASDPHITLLEWAGLSLATVGVIGEAIADHQSEAFKRRDAGATRILDVGLWRYSRHPNYFFEILTWVGFALASLSFQEGWLVIACPVLIIYFLLRVTGVPLTEKHSIETHGDAYRDYQRRTSTVVPWPPKA